MVIPSVLIILASVDGPAKIHGIHDLQQKYVQKATQKHNF